MIILDTNVLSETMKDVPEPKVLEWLWSRTKSQMYITSLTDAEVRYGIALLPTGKRRTQLEELSEGALGVFAGRTLAFDSNAAKRFAAIASIYKKTGMSVEGPDLQIAAIASAHGFSIATRNVKHFAKTGVQLINPWH